MQVEDVARIGFPARRTAKQQGHLAIGDGLLGQVVVDDDGVHAVVPEPLAHGASGEGGQELQRGRLGRRRGDDDGVFKGPALFQGLDDLGDGRALLADGDIDAIELGALVIAGIDRLLVQDGVDGHGGLAGLTISNDQLALTATDRDQGVDGLQAGLHRLVHGLPRNDARRLHVHPATLGHVLDRALAIDGLAQGVDDPAQQAPAHRNVHDLGEAADFVALGDGPVLAEDHDPDIVALEVQGHALHPRLRELDHLAGLDIIQAEDPGDAVPDGQDLPDIGHIGVLAEVGDLGLQNSRDFGSADIHGLRSLEGELEGIELRAKRSVEEFGADPDADSAEKGGIDAGLDLGGLAEGGPECLGDALGLGGGHRGGSGDQGGYRAAGGGVQGLEGGDGFRQGCSAAIARQKAKELLRGLGEIRLGGEGGEGLGLVRGGEGGRRQ